MSDEPKDEAESVTPGVHGAVLDGPGATDYERYVRTDELLLLQKRQDERAHRDELLFQVVHQSHELWLKLAANEVGQAAIWIQEGSHREARRVLHRAVLAVEYIYAQLSMLEQISAWEYHEIRRVLGNGSGFDSPGFKSLRRALTQLWRAFEGSLGDAGIDLVTLYVEAAAHDALHEIAEEMADLDTRLQEWRIRHYRVVVRAIGDGVVGTQGTPVEAVGRLVQVLAFPNLWQVRNTLTRMSDRTVG